MSEMKERIEDAISEACEHALPPWLLEKCASAAIAAIREPTEDMIEKGMWSRSENGQYSPRDIAVTIYKAMIDQALVELGPLRPAGSADLYGVPRAEE